MNNKDRRSSSAAPAQISDDKSFRKARDEYWRMLREAWLDYQTDVDTTNVDYMLDGFQVYMEKRYGVQIFMEGSNIGGYYEVLDEAKHNLFLLKYLAK